MGVYLPLMKMTIYVPDELYRAMKEAPVCWNWSLLAQKAFAKQLGLKIKPREPTRVIRKKP